MTLCYLPLLSPWQQLQHFVVVSTKTAQSQPPPHLCETLTYLHLFQDAWGVCRVHRPRRCDWMFFFVRFFFFSGARNQPLVQLQRKSLQLPSNSNYTALSAALTTARTQYEIGGFPFLLGQETNSSGRCRSQKSQTLFTQRSRIIDAAAVHQFSTIGRSHRGFF